MFLRSLVFLCFLWNAASLQAMNLQEGKETQEQSNILNNEIELQDTYNPDEFIVDTTLLDEKKIEENSELELPNKKFSRNGISSNLCRVFCYCGSCATAVIAAAYIIPTLLCIFPLQWSKEYDEFFYKGMETGRVDFGNGDWYQNYRCTNEFPCTWGGLYDKKLTSKDYGTSFVALYQNTFRVHPEEQWFYTYKKSLWPLSCSVCHPVFDPFQIYNDYFKKKILGEKEELPANNPRLTKTSIARQNETHFQKKGKNSNRKNNHSHRKGSKNFR